LVIPSARIPVRDLTRRRGAALVVASAAVVALAGCSGEEASGVETGEVGRATVVEVVEAAGTVTARATSAITSPAGGTIASIEVADGATVAAGQVLVRISSPAAEETLARAQEADRQAAAAAPGAFQGLDLSQQGAQADAAAAQAFAAARQAAEAIQDPAAKAQALAQVAQAEAQYASARASTEQAVDTVNAALRSAQRALSSLAQAQRSQTQAAVAIAQATVDALVVKAPIAGVASFGAGTASGGSGSDVSGLLSQLPESVQGAASSFLGGSSSSSFTSGPIEVGRPVATGDPLLSVTDVSALSLAASVDETDILLVQPGIQAEVELDAVPGARYPATVTAIDVAPTTSSRGGVAYTVRLALSAGTDETGAAAPAPRPGMSAVARLQVRTAQDAVAVPVAAVFRDQGRDAVWVVDNGRVERRELVLGAQGTDEVQVTEGLEVGEVIVVRGADRVVEGQQIP